jgi:hypothetical protein
MLNWNDVLAPALTLVTRESAGELVVVLPDKGKFVVLNATGARVLQLSDGTRALREIADTLAAECGADQAQVDGDVQRFAQALVDRGALHVR